MEIDETLKMWLERFRRSEDYVKTQRDRGRENYRLYKSYKNQEEKLYKHDIFVPYSFAFLEDLSAYFMLSVMASTTLYSVEPRWAAVDVEMCRALEAVINWVMQDERMEFALELEEVLKNVNIFNSGYLINYPSMMTAETGKVDESGEKVTADHLDYIYLDAAHPFQMYPEPGPKRLSRSNWIIKQSFETMDALKKWEKNGIYKNIGDIKPTEQTSETDPIQQLQAEIGLTPVTFNENRVELLDCFCDHDVTTIANRRLIIRDTTKDLLSPYLDPLPVLDCRFAGAPGEFESIGALEAMKPLQKDLNSLRSQRRDNISLILNKQFKYNMLAGEVDLTTLFSAPGNVILMQGDCISELETEDITPSSYREEQSLIYDLQSVLCFWDYGRGATPKRKETATGIIRLQQAAQARNEWHLRKLDAYILQPLCRRVINYIREYLPEGDAVKIAGDEYAGPLGQFYGLSTDDLRRLVQIRPLTETINSIKEIDTNQFLQAFDRLIRIQGLNQTALVKVLLQKLGQRNVKEIIGAVPSGAGQDATAAALKNAMAGAGGGAAASQISGFLNTQTPPAIGAGAGA